MAQGTRVDQALVARELVKDINEARRLVMAGKILLNDQMVIKASQIVEDHQQLRVIQDPDFVSRGGEKLQEAFDQFPLSVDGLVCADIGASTGGFTDCLLQNGAFKIYAIDVGYGILDWKLRNHPRVAVLERTNARSLRSLPEPTDFFCADVSFISLKLILPQASQWYSQAGGEAVVLIKPQFEATREEAALGSGVIRDPKIHRRVLNEVLGFAVRNQFQINGLIPSPLLGPDGNREFLAWLSFPSTSELTEDLQTYISSIF